VNSVDGSSATEVDHTDEYGNGPAHPHDDVRFAVRFGEYPGGEDAYWRDFRNALIAYDRHWCSPSGADGGKPREIPDEWVDTQTYYALRRRAYELSVVVAAAAGISKRNMAQWLVKAQGFPGRDDCLREDFRRMVAFLEEPGVIEQARHAPDYPDWRDRLPRGRRPDEIDDKGGTPEPLTLAQVHDVLVRFSAGELSDEQAACLAGPTFDAADADREERRDDPDGLGADAWHVLEEDRATVLGETRYLALLAALRAQQ
jgi:hypothetical protein